MNIATQQLLGEGVQLMLIGMGSVFIFLSVLVLTLKLVSALVKRIEPNQPTITIPVRTNPTPVSDQQEIVAVITAAISQYRSRP